VAVETFDFNENRPRICEPKCIQKAEKIVYRHPDATRFLPNSGKRSCSTATCVGNPRTSNLAPERLLRICVLILPQTWDAVTR